MSEFVKETLHFSGAQAWQGLYSYFHLGENHLLSAVKLQVLNMASIRKQNHTNVSSVTFLKFYETAQHYFTHA